jgi:hypothetical protein
MSVDTLLQIAQDHSSSPAKLREVWAETTSSRVRKAVASNPNCDTPVMCMAARLYIKEVLANPSFELNTLFSEDKLVADIYNAYTDPSGFYGSKSRGIRGGVAAKDRGVVCRALLVSPNLSSPKILEEIVSIMSSAEFVRELKDGEVRKRVEKLAKSGVDRFSVYTSAFLLNKKLLSMADFSRSLEKRSAAEFHLPAKAYCETFKKVYEDADYDSLYHFTLASSPYALKHLVKGAKGDYRELFTSDNCLKDLAKLYKDVLAYEHARERRTRGGRYGYYALMTSYGDSDHSYHISDLIWDCIAYRNEMDGKSLCELDFARLFSDVQLVGFDKDYGPHKCRLKFKNLNTLTGRNDLCQKLLDLEGDDAFEFFMTCGFLWTDWYARGDTGNLESRVMERMHRINEARNGRYYTYSIISDYPYITIVNRNGINYSHEQYHRIDDTNTNPPRGTGLVARPRS